VHNFPQENQRGLMVIDFKSGPFLIIDENPLRHHFLRERFLHKDKCVIRVMKINSCIHFIPASKPLIRHSF